MSGVRVCVEFDYDAEQPDELSIKKGDIITNVKKLEGGWWEGNLNGKKGVFPDNFGKEMPPDEPKSTAVQSRNGPTTDQLNNVKRLGEKIGAGIGMGAPPKKLGSKKVTAVVTYAYKAEQLDELDLTEGDIVEITKQEEEGWWEGIAHGKKGVFPNNFVKLVSTPTAESEPVQPVEAIRRSKPPIGGQAMLPSDALGGKPAKPLPSRSEPPPSNQNQPSGPALPERERKDKKRQRAKVLFSYHAVNDDELSLDEGQVITVIDRHLDDPGWWKGEIRGKVGVFPDNFVELIPDDTPRAQRPPPTVPSANTGPKPPATLPETEDTPPPPGPKPFKQVPSKPEPAPGARPLPSHKHEAPQQSPQALNPLPKAPTVAATSTAPAVSLETETQLRKEIEMLKSSTVSRDTYRLQEKEMADFKSKMEIQMKDLKQAMADLMREIDQNNKQNNDNKVELDRLRKLAEKNFVGK